MSYFFEACGGSPVCRFAHFAVSRRALFACGVIRGPKLPQRPQLAPTFVDPVSCNPSNSVDTLWLVVWNMFFSPYIGNFIIPPDLLQTFFRGVGWKPPTSSHSMSLEKVERQWCVVNAGSPWLMNLIPRHGPWIWDTWYIVLMRIYPHYICIQYNIIINFISYYYIFTVCVYIYMCVCVHIDTVFALLSHHLPAWPSFVSRVWSCLIHQTTRNEIQQDTRSTKKNTIFFSGDDCQKLTFCLGNTFAFRFPSCGSVSCTHVRASCRATGARTGAWEVEGGDLYYPNDAPLQRHGWIILDQTASETGCGIVGKLEKIGNTSSKYHRGSTLCYLIDLVGGLPKKVLR